MRRAPFLALLLLTLAAPAQAQFNRVYASARSGNDLNSCNSITSPCQSFQGAANQVAAGGSIIVLDTGGYGPVTITKALTIDVPSGVIAFIHPSSGSGVTVNAGSTDVVILRGLSVNTSSGTFAGIDFIAGGTLRVENCVVNGFASGIRAESGLLFVRDTTIRTCSTGITVGNRVLVERCRLKGNQYGLIASFGSRVIVRDCNVSGNAQAGMALDSHTNGLSAELNIEDCLLAHNGTAVLSLVYGGGLGQVRISNSTVTNNTTGLWADGGSLLSRVNNTVEGNTTNTTGPITPYGAK
jgi:Right handed beta helix region